MTKVEQNIHQTEGYMDSVNDFIKNKKYQAPQNFIPTLKVRMSLK